jgi:hypothetical protein
MPKEPDKPAGAVRTWQIAVSPGDGDNRSGSDGIGGRAWYGLGAAGSRSPHSENEALGLPSALFSRDIFQCGGDFFRAGQAPAEQTQDR